MLHLSILQPHRVGLANSHFYQSDSRGTEGLNNLPRFPVQKPVSVHHCRDSPSNWPSANLPGCPLSSTSAQLAGVERRTEKHSLWLSHCGIWILWLAVQAAAGTKGIPCCGGWYPRSFLIPREPVGAEEQYYRIQMPALALSLETPESPSQNLQDLHTDFREFLSFANTIGFLETP